MNEQTVFEVVDVSLFRDDVWLVRGRAWEDVRLGDCLAVGASEANDGTPRPSFEIVGISTYGREIDELNRMMTGNLLLHGPAGDRLLGTEFLIRQPPSAAHKRTTAEPGGPSQ